jgi:hypothetical protein
MQILKVGYPRQREQIVRRNKENGKRNLPDKLFRRVTGSVMRLDGRP